MKKILLLLIIVSLQYGQEGVSFNISPSWKITEGLLNPIEMKIKDDYLYVFDYGSDYPFTRIDVKTKEVQSFGKWGMGPSEVSRRGGIELCGFDDNFIYIADKVQRKIMLFNLNNLKYNSLIDIPDISALNILFDPLQKRFVINEANMGHYFFSEWSLDVPKKSGPFTIKGKERFGNLKEFELLNVCAKNFLLKQGCAEYDNVGNLYFLTSNGSLVLAFDKQNKNIFMTLKPFEVKIPDFVTFPGMEGFMSPPINLYPETYVGMDVDNDYVYGIYSGFQDNSKTSKFEDVEYGHGNKLIIFNKSNGSVFKILILPIRIKRIQVTPKNIYFLSTDKEIAIYKYNKESFYEHINKK